jgi:uncharacterized OsmC-like protein/esterase/lipase
LARHDYYSINRIVVFMASKRITFTNQKGQTLAARLQLPVGERLRYCALFAHCFTCGKDLTAMRNIAKGLNQNGVAVLLFDFTGLGDSEGDFADTNFSSNVDDLVAAAEYMAGALEAPRMIIGHSLGGAAAIVAAERIDAVQAVVTIGAPADPAHVKGLFRDELSEIEARGEANVRIAGRSFKVKKQFLDDVRSQNLESILADMRKALLVMHSPQDVIVGIQNAEAIYTTAHHPKSFITLDGADHLLSRTNDSWYVGNVIANWAIRYIDEEVHWRSGDAGEISSEQQVAARIGAEDFSVEISAGHHFFFADETPKKDAPSLGPSPYDLMLASLGACTAMTLRLYAVRKKWDLREAIVRLSHEKEYVQDCENCEDPKARIDVIDARVELSGDLDETQRQRLLEIAGKCPVHKAFKNGMEIRGITTAT